MNKTKHLLVIRLSAMGDVAMTVPVIYSLATQHPELKVTVVSRAFLKPLFHNIPNVTFYTADVNGKHKGIKGLYTLSQEVKGLGIDAVADLHNVLRSKITSRFLKFSGLPVATIDKGRAEKKQLTALKNKVFQPLKSTHQRYADVFETLGLPVDLSNPTLKPKETFNDNLKSIIAYQKEDILLGIAPFAAHEGKKYPLELMQQAIGEILEKNTQVKVILFGGGQTEIKLLNDWASTSKRIVNLAGKVKLQEELAMISQLNCMVSMDSGNGHFAALYGVPTISIWGATHPYAGFAPFLQEENCICADRTQFPLLPTSVYGNKIIPGYEKVMWSIKPETIAERVLEIVGR